MLKYKIHRKLIKVICDCCHKEFEKPISEYNRNIALNRSNYCSRSCAITMCNRKYRRTGNIKNLKVSIPDEYTPFRYYLRNCRNRFKECTITLDDLKQLWNKQKGICPYTGQSLVLATYSKIPKSKINLASLDRIDSSLGYIPGNLQFVALPINLMKNNLSQQDTLILCKHIANNFLSDRTILSS